MLVLGKADDSLKYGHGKYSQYQDGSLSSTTRPRARPV
jgi:hypothetical protein